jgi:hypothetical protein
MSETKEIELKSCPFCDSISRTKVIGPTGPWNLCYVSCQNLNCYARGPMRFTREGAINAWNEREGEVKP